MGLLDSVLGGLMGGGGASPIQNVLMGMLGGNQQGFGQQNGGQQSGMPMGGFGGGNFGGGGLGGLVSSFEQAGLGHIAQSWIGNGPNQPVSPQQLHSVLGESQVESMASQSGMQSGDFLQQLAQHLPNVVNGMTPHGRLPDEGTISV